MIYRILENGEIKCRFQMEHFHPMTQVFGNAPSKAKYLGVTIDSKLSWNSHTDTVTKRVNHRQLTFAEIFQAAQRM